MKHKKQLLATECIAVLCCFGLLTGCGGSSETVTVNSSVSSSVTSSAAGSSGIVESGSVEETEEVSSNGYRDVIGKVTYADSDYLTVTSYSSEDDVDDYAVLDISTLTEGSITRYIYVSEETEYYAVEEESLVAASLDDVKMDAMIAETTSDEGVQQIIILDPGDDTQADLEGEEETPDAENGEDSSVQ